MKSPNENTFESSVCCAPLGIETPSDGDCLGAKFYGFQVIRTCLL